MENVKDGNKLGVFFGNCGLPPAPAGGGACDVLVPLIPAQIEPATHLCDVKVK